MRRKILLIGLTLAFLSGCTAASTPPTPVLEAPEPEPQAVSVSDQEYITLAQTLQARNDRKITIAPDSSKYAQRLARLMDSHAREEGRAFTYKVYMTRSVVADAMPTGDIRISVGFMSMLTDNELRFVMGHLIGQIRHGDMLEVLRTQFLLLKTNKGTAALSAAEQDKLLAAISNFHFSLAQEEKADDFAYAFMKKHNYDLRSAVSVLQKLDRLDKGTRFVTSHTESSARAQRIADRLNNDKR